MFENLNYLRYCIVELLGSNFQKMLDKFLTGIPPNYIHYYTGRKLWCLGGSLYLWLAVMYSIITKAQTATY